MSFSSRTADWAGHVLAEDALLAMPEIGIEIPLAELYLGLVFETPEDGEAAPESP